MTEPDPTPRASAKDLKAFSDEVSPRLVELLDTSGLPLPRDVHRRAKTAAKSFSFTREVKLTQACEVVAFLAAYRQVERVGELARTMARAPYTGNATLYEPVRRAVHAGYYFASRAGDAEAADDLRPYLLVPADFTRPPSYLAGELLRQWLDLPEEEAAEYRKHPGTSRPSYHAGMIAPDLLDLASMHVCGGSATWPRERIDAQVDANIAGLYAVPGYALPAEVGD
jgi:hypothetical protein